MQDDPVTTMSADHAHVQELADQLEAAEKGGDADAAADLAKELIDALNSHAKVEEEVFYRALLRVAPDLAPQVDEVLGDHTEAKSMLFQAATSDLQRTLEGNDSMPDTELLIEAAQKHTEAEEKLFDTIREEGRAPELAEAVGDGIDELRNTLDSAQPPAEELDDRRKKRRAKAIARHSSDSDDAVGVSRSII